MKVIYLILYFIGLIILAFVILAFIYATLTGKPESLSKDGMMAISLFNISIFAGAAVTKYMSKES